MRPHFNCYFCIRFIVREL